MATGCFVWSKYLNNLKRYYVQRVHVGYSCSTFETKIEIYSGSSLFLTVEILKVVYLYILCIL